MSDMRYSTMDEIIAADAARTDEERADDDARCLEAIQYLSESIRLFRAACKRWAKMHPDHRRKRKRVMSKGKPQR